jgi:tripeptide aminopeptidase
MSHRSLIILPIVALGLALCAAPTTAQGQQSAFTPGLTLRPGVRDALNWLDRNFPAQVEEWIHITEIPAPSRQEERRAGYLMAELEKAGLIVTIDSIGNVIARRRGTGDGPTIVLAAHMDTVHPIDTDVRVRRSGDMLHAPGVFDNSASLANLLAVVRAMNRANIRTKGDIIFIATVQEELGLIGMDFWLKHNPGVANLLVAIDGGLGPINYGALGIYWTRYHFRGAGSHTNTSQGKPHPARALAAAIQSIYEIRIPEGQGGAVYNVGMLDGGKIFNAIPEEVSFTMDLRSVNPALLDSLDREIEARVARAATTEGVKWDKEIVTRNKAGGTEAMLRERRGHALVQTAVAIHRFLAIDIGAEGVAATGSTDANMGVVRGIPSISIGRSRGGDQHTLSEWSEVRSALPATKMLFLLAIAMAGLSDGAN